MQLEVPAAPITGEFPEIRQRTFLRIVFSFPAAIAGLLVALMCLTVRSRFSDPDLWWHLKLGELIWNTHRIPRVDLFSYTAAGHSWIPQEWLSQVTIYAAYFGGGYTGLMLWFCVLVSALAIATYALCAVYSGNPKVAFVGGLAFWLFSTVGLAIRPQLIGFLLLSCQLFILHLGSSRDSRYFLVLPPLFAFWINLHSSFIFGLIVFVVVLFCSFCEFRLGLLVSQRLERRTRMILTASFALSLIALFANPIGPKLIWYPLDVMLKLRLNTTQISEWQPPQFNNMRSLAVLTVALLILLIPLLRRIELTFQELLFTAIGFGLAVQHERMLFLFGILSAPILCRLLATAWDQYEPDRDRPLPNAALLAVSVGALVLGFPSRHLLSWQVERGNPVKAVDFINRSGLAGRMFNEYVYGGYLIWAAPQHKVFVDGRGDVFEWTGVLADYGKLITVQADPRPLLEKYRVDFCVLSRGAPLVNALPLLPGWTKIYFDDSSVVFARSGARVRKS